MKTQHEQWKAIAECNGEYYISDHGRVKSYKLGRERILKQGYDSYKYPIVGIYKNGKSKTTCIHKLVAMAFISNPNNKPQVNHIDGNKLNNHKDNLEWVTSSENLQHAWDTGLFESKRLAIIKAQSKPVVDIENDKKYDSLKLACEDTNQSYSCHKQRIIKRSPLQRFFHINDNGNG